MTISARLGINRGPGVDQTQERAAHLSRPRSPSIWRRSCLGSPDELDLEAEARGLLPIYGHCPHYVSLRISDGAILQSNWDDIGREAWLVEIAPSLTEYIATLIEIREAFTKRSKRALYPSDWWRPYAMQGSRLDV